MHCIKLQILVRTAHNVTSTKRNVSPPVCHTLFPRRTPLITVMKWAPFNPVRLCSEVCSPTCYRQRSSSSIPMSSKQLRHFQVLHFPVLRCPVYLAFIPFCFGFPIFSFPSLSAFPLFPFPDPRKASRRGWGYFIKNFICGLVRSAYLRVSSFRFRENCLLSLRVIPGYLVPLNTHTVVRTTNAASEGVEQSNKIVGLESGHILGPLSEI